MIIKATIEKLNSISIIYIFFILTANASWPLLVVFLGQPLYTTGTIREGRGLGRVVLIPWRVTIKMIS